MLAAVPLWAASWQPAPIVRTVRTHIETVRTPIEIVHSQRAPAVEMLLPKAVAAVAFLPALFVVVTNSLPTEQRLRIQKSPMLQGGTKMKSMKTTKKQPPRVKGVRLNADVLEVTRTFKKEYPTKELEFLWGALLKCYGSKELALAAVKANPQSAPAPPPWQLAAAVRDHSSH